MSIRDAFELLACFIGVSYPQAGSRGESDRNLQVGSVLRSY